MRFAASMIACLVLSGCGEIGRPVVTIGTESLSLEDLRRTYADLPPASRPSLSTRPQRTAFVDDIVRRRLLLEHGGALPESSSSELAIERDREDVLLRRLLAIEGGMADPTEAELEEARARFATRFRVRRVICVAREDAERAAEMIARGAPAESIATGARCRVLAPETWTWFPWPIDPLGDAVIPLEPGQVSPPVDGEGFVQIAQLLERSTASPEVEFPASSRLAEGVRREKRERAVLALERSLRDKADVRYDADTMRLLVERTRESILSARLVESDPGFAIPALSPQEESLALATYRGNAGNEERYLAGEYLRALRSVNPGRRPWRGSLETVVRRAVDQEVGRRLLVREAERRGIPEDWWAARDLRLLEENSILRRGRRAIETSVTLSEASIDSMTTLLLLAQPNVLRHPPRARVVRVDFPTEQAALEERGRAIASGGLLRRFSDVLEGRQLSTGAYHLFRISAGGLGSVEIDQLVFATPPGRVLGPVRFGASWILLEVQGFDSAADRESDAFRAEVQRNLQEGRSAAAVDAWVRARRKEVGIQIDDELLDRLSPGV